MSIDMNAVPVLSRKQVENMAEQVLQDAGRKLDVRFNPPIDIETIAEHYFGMQIIYRYLFTVRRIPDLYGALLIWDKKSRLRNRCHWIAPTSPLGMNSDIGCYTGIW